VIGRLGAVGRRLGGALEQLDAGLEVLVLDLDHAEILQRVDIVGRHRQDLLVERPRASSSSPALWRLCAMMNRGLKPAMGERYAVLRGSGDVAREVAKYGNDFVTFFLEFPIPRAMAAMHATGS